ncbi:MAG: hypothetical protein EOS61_29705 [Mesorhizobium sp.]|nr:MAG: hypothetical protein EOS61_29705 [Mesorhizobium sp.]
MTRAAENIAAEVGGAIQKSQQLYGRRGGVILPKPSIITGTAATSVAAPTVAAAKPHTFFGKKI